MISHCCKGKLLKKNSRGRQRTKNWKCLHLLGSSSFQRKGRIWLELSACHCPLYAGVSSYSLHLRSIITVSAAQLGGNAELLSPQTFLRARKRSCYFQLLLFFCPSVTWLAFYICNTQKLGLLFKRHREREREGEREGERERMSNGKEPLQSYINQACGRSSALANGNAREM